MVWERLKGLRSTDFSWPYFGLSSISFRKMRALGSLNSSAAPEFGGIRDWSAHRALMGGSGGQCLNAGFAVLIGYNMAIIMIVSIQSSEGGSALARCVP